MNRKREDNKPRVWRKVSSEPKANSNPFLINEFGASFAIIEKTCPLCIRLLQIDHYYAKSESKRRNKIPSDPELDFESVCIECWDNRKKEREFEKKTGGKEYTLLDNV